MTNLRELCKIVSTIQLPALPIFQRHVATLVFVSSRIPHFHFACLSNQRVRYAEGQYDVFKLQGDMTTLSTQLVVVCCQHAKDSNSYVAAPVHAMDPDRYCELNADI